MKPALKRSDQNTAGARKNCRATNCTPAETKRQTGNEKKSARANSKANSRANSKEKITKRQENREHDHTTNSITLFDLLFVIPKSRNDME